jgi:O-antigen ligase
VPYAASASGRSGSWIAGVAALVALAAVSAIAIALADATAALICLSLIASAFILLDFRVGVVLLVLLMPISTSTIFPREMAGITGLNPLNLLMAATLGSYLLRAAADGSLRRFVPPKLFWLYLLPFVAAGILGSRHVGEIPLGVFPEEQIPFTNANGYLRDIVLKPLLLVVFALLVAAAVKRSREPERFLVPALVSIWFLGLLVIGFVLKSGLGLDYLSGARSRSFLSQLGLHANDFGRLYAVAYALMLFTWAVTHDRVLKLALAVSMVLVVAALVLTFSRGAFFAFLVVNVIFLFTRRRALGVVLGALLIGAMMFALPAALYDRVTVGFEGDLNSLSAGRVDGIWLPLLPEIARSPFFGSGLSSILWSGAMRGGSLFTVSHAHNAYLQALLDMGGIGLALVCAFFALLLRDFARLGREARVPPTLRGFFSGGAAGLASFLVAGVAGSLLTPCPEQVYLWLAVGMLYGVRARLASRPRSPAPRAGLGPRHAQAA